MRQQPTGTKSHRQKQLNKAFRAAPVILTCFIQLTFFSQSLYAARTVYPDTLTTSFRRYAIAPFMRPARKTVGMAFSGGGANGLAQIGVLKAFEEENIPVDYIAGTSMGAIVGGLYSCGYSPEELEKIAKTLPWDTILSIREESHRAGSFLEQQRVRDRATVAIRFNKLKLTVPKSLSSAQALTFTLDALVLNGLYHGWRDFNDLPVRFRAVSTDLVSGKRVTLDSGSLSEAIRASSTVPVLFAPVERDGYHLVDGGLVANLPVDELDHFNANYKIAVDTHGSMYSNIDDLDLPWKAADQAVTILTGLQYPAQLEKADIVIAPDLKSYNATDFSRIDELIRTGYATGKTIAGTVRKGIASQPKQDVAIGSFTKSIRIEGTAGLDPEREAAVSGIVRNARSLSRSFQALLATDLFTKVYAELDTKKRSVVFHLSPLPRIAKVVVSGGPEQRLSETETEGCFERITGRTYTNKEGTKALETLVRLYRTKGYSLVEPERITLLGDTLVVGMSPGKVSGIEIVRSGEKTSMTAIKREIVVDTTKALQLAKAEKSTTGLYETGIFNRVSVAAAKHASPAGEGQRPLTFSLVEKPSSVLRIGVRYDETSNAQVLLDLRNENLEGTTASLGGWIKAGNSSNAATIEYTIPRIGATQFTFFSKLFFEQHEFETRQLQFAKEFQGHPSQTSSTYGMQKYGLSGSFGTRIGKNGRFAVNLNLQNAQTYHEAGPEIASLSTNNLNMLSVGSSLTIDSRNRASLATSGRYSYLGYTLTPKVLDNDMVFWQLSGTHEENIPLGKRLSLQLSGSFGISGSYLPVSEQFFLGGPGSSYSKRFIGLKQNDLIGRNMAVGGVQLSYTPPLEIIFPGSLMLYYNAGNVWENRSDISFSNLIHGIGTGFVWNTPIGPARLTVSKAFAFLRNEDDLSSSSLRFSDTVLYFSLGHDF